MTAQRLRDAVVLEGSSIVMLSQLATAGLAALERSNGYTAGAQVRELVAVLARTASDYRARSAVSGGGQVRDTGSMSSALCDQSAEIGTAEAALLLGVHERSTRRIAADLGGRQVSGRWVFDRQVVTAAAEMTRRNQ